MGDTKTTLEYRGRKVEMNDENTAAAMEQVGKEPIQMQLAFKRVYGDVATKEAIRGVTAIIREAVRFGADKEQIQFLLMNLIRINPIVESAIDLMDEKLLNRGE